MPEHVARELGVPLGSVELTRAFPSYGLSSITGFTLTCDLSEWLNVDLPADLLWDYPTITELAEHLSEPEDSAVETTA
jgi:acyl carrier protein